MMAGCSPSGSCVDDAIIMMKVIVLNIITGIPCWPLPVYRVGHAHRVVQDDQVDHVD